MNTKEYRIFVVILIILAAIVIGYTATRHTTTVTTSSTATVPAGSTVIPISIVSVRDTSSTSPQLDVEYPQFADLPPSANDAIASATLSRLDTFKEDVKETMAARAATGGGAVIATSSYSFTATWEPAQVNGRYISFIERYDSYSGGANENQEVQTFNFDVASGTPVTLADLFPDSADPLKLISALARSQLRASLMNASPGYDPDHMLNEGTAPTTDNFSNFTFDEYAITFYFPKYAVAPGAFGEQRAQIPLSSIR